MGPGKQPVSWKQGQVATRLQEDMSPNFSVVFISAFQDDIAKQMFMKYQVHRVGGS